MAAPKPITLVAVDEEDYAGPTPQPFSLVGGFPAADAPTQAAFNTLVARVEALEGALEP